jgi:uncharacterized protein YndB with AHSA1/START domain
MPVPEQQQMHEFPVIERSTELDLDLDQVWELISTAAGWASWLVDEADVNVAPGEEGSACDDERRRDVRIESIVERRQVTFSWWDRDDPASASRVQLAIVELPNGGSRLDVSERFVGRAMHATRAMDTSFSSSMAKRWEVKLVLLCVLALPSLVTA